MGQFAESGLAADITGVGHRIVYGGVHHSAPEPVTAELLADLESLIPIDPEHLPQAIAGMHATGTRLPGVPQFALFDSHFHESMPPVAKALPLPRSITDKGVRRFGFHGLSYQSVMHQLGAINAAPGNIVIAHLGSGSSMAAIQNGQSIDTTMGFTPTGGLMMGARPGDLDPGILVYLTAILRLSGDEIDDLLNRRSGLLGVSARSNDMRDLLDHESSDSHVFEAIALYCHIARKHLGALILELGGIDTLVFTGGIGEHSAPIRSRICANLDFLGVSLDTDCNGRNEAIISADDSRVTVRIVPADEEATIARLVLSLEQDKEG